MKLNREKVAAGLTLLMLIFGVYKMVGSRVSASLPAISTDIPAYTQEIPRIEPRLFVEARPGGRNPFQTASDWAAIAPEEMPPPPPELTRWIMIPLGKEPVADETGYAYLSGPPQPTDSEEGKASKPPSGSESSPKKDEKSEKPSGSPGTKERGAGDDGGGESPKPRRAASDPPEGGTAKIRVGSRGKP